MTLGLYLRNTPSSCVTARCLNNKHDVFFAAEKACRNSAVLICKMVVVLLCSSFRPNFPLSSRSDTLTPAPERLAVRCRLTLSAILPKLRSARCLCDPCVYVLGRWRRGAWWRGGTASSGAGRRCDRRRRRAHQTTVGGVAANSLSYRGGSWKRSVNEARLSNRPHTGGFDLSAAMFSGCAERATTVRSSVVVCLPLQLAGPTSCPQSRRTSVAEVRH